MAVTQDDYKANLHDSERPEKGGRNAALTLWGVIALVVLAAILFTMLVGKRPIAPDQESPTTPGPAGKAVSVPNQPPAPAAQPGAEAPAPPTQASARAMEPNSPNAPSRSGANPGSHP
ncbi:MAG: hypothetical protein ACOY0T_06420 [Myxococcota bacterium]